MVRHGFILLLSLFTGAGISVAQRAATVEGVVLDSTTRQPLPEAAVHIVGKAIGDVADSTGFYQISNVPAGMCLLRASRIGYEAQTVDTLFLSAGETRRVDFFLQARMVQLRGVEVEADRLWEKHLTEASLVGVHHIRARDIGAIPGALDDPSRAVQIFSGVSGGGDYSGYLAVRGGSPDQNQVIMDGVIIPNPYRFRLAFGGGLSIINPNTTEDIYLHLGGFSAEYGNALSSILEVQSRTSAREHVRFQGSLNFTDMNALVEGPVANHKGGYLFSFRRTYYDLIVNQFASNHSAFPFFYEFSSHWTLDLTESDRLTIRYTRSREGAELQEEFLENLRLEEEAESDMASITWRKLIGERWRLNTTLSWYRDETSYRAFARDTSSTVPNEQEEPVPNNDVLDLFESLNAKEKNFSFKHEIRLKTGHASWLTWGGSATIIPAEIDFDSAELNFVYGRTEAPKDIQFGRSHRYYATYLESSTQATDRLHLRIGARYDASTLVDEGELSPRFSIWYELDEHTRLEGSWGLFYQYPNPMTVYSRNTPVDLSQNLNILSAEKATHQIVGIEREFGQAYVARAQFYRKEFDRLLLPEDEVTYLPRNDGRGFANGLEFILEKKPGPDSRLSGIVSYAFGRARYRSQSSGSQEWRRFKYDRRHALTVLGDIRLFDRWSLSLLGQLASGLPYTEVTGLRNHSIHGMSEWRFVHGPRFGAQFPTFKKVDARLSYRRRGRGDGFEFYLDIINLTNEKNTYEITWEQRSYADGRQETTRRKIFMLPRIPSFGINFRF
ncbi:MAG: TonB-dependent receptor domain-containing protein [bacterium]